MRNINDIARLINLIDIHGLNIKVVQNDIGFQISGTQGRHITPILSANETYSHLESILNALNELNTVKCG